MLGVWDYTFHPFGFNMFQRFHHPREDTENCQSSGSPKPQTLGSPLAGALGSDDSMLVQVAIYVWSKWTKKRPKKTEFQRECLKIIPADAKTVRLAYIFGRLFHFTILLLRLLLLPGLGQHWKWTPLNHWIHGTIMAPLPGTDDPRCWDHSLFSLFTHDIIRIHKVSIAPASEESRAFAFAAWNLHPSRSQHLQSLNLLSCVIMKLIANCSKILDSMGFHGIKKHVCKAKRSYPQFHHWLRSQTEASLEDFA